LKVAFIGIEKLKWPSLSHSMLNAQRFCRASVGFHPISPWIEPAHGDFHLDD